MAATATCLPVPSTLCRVNTLDADTEWPLCLLPPDSVAQMMRFCGGSCFNNCSIPSSLLLVFCSAALWSLFSHSFAFSLALFGTGGGGEEEGL